MRLLGIDFGDARVGLALSDPTGLIASGIGTVNVKGIGSAVKAILPVIGQYNCDKIICGLPINMNGTEGIRAERVRLFAQRLSEASGLEVELVDERRTTVMAHSFMDSTGTFGKKRKESVDTLSAQIILQTYLDMKR